MKAKLGRARQQPRHGPTLQLSLILYPFDDHFCMASYTILPKFLGFGILNYKVMQELNHQQYPKNLSNSFCGGPAVSWLGRRLLSRRKL